VPDLPLPAGAQAAILDLPEDERPTVSEIMLAGMAEMLRLAGVVSFTWYGEPYADPPASPLIPALYLVELQPEPERVVALTDYPLEAMPGLSDSLVGVQCRIRVGREPAPAMRIRDRIKDVWHGAGPLYCDLSWLDSEPSFAIAQIGWQSAAPIGPDSQGRYERSENYYVNINRHSVATDTD